MPVVLRNKEIEKEICDALGLKHVISLDLHMALEDITLLTVKYYPEKDAIKKMTAILAKYTLVKIEEDKNVTSH